MNDKQRFSSVWESIEDTPQQATSMRARSELMMNLTHRGLIAQVHELLSLGAVRDSRNGNGLSAEMATDNQVIKQMLRGLKVSAEDELQMARFGISNDGTYYCLQEHRYENLADAVAYAKYLEKLGRLDRS